MLRWVAIGLGCVTALGLEVLFDGLARRVGLPLGLPTEYAAMFLALLLAGFVTGHFARTYEVLHGALAATLYILVRATITAIGEIPVVLERGPQALPPIELGQLVITDLVALAGASLGGWLSRVGISQLSGGEGSAPPDA